jgi:hypothetical protein
MISMQVGNENVGDLSTFDLIFCELHLCALATINQVGFILCLQNTWAVGFLPKAGKAELFPSMVNASK